MPSDIVDPASTASPPDYYTIVKDNAPPDYESAIRLENQMSNSALIYQQHGSAHQSQSQPLQQQSSSAPHLSGQSLSSPLLSSSSQLPDSIVSTPSIAVVVPTAPSPTPSAIGDSLQPFPPQQQSHYQSHQQSIEMKPQSSASGSCTEFNQSTSPTTKVTPSEDVHAATAAVANDGSSNVPISSNSCPNHDDSRKP